MKILRRGLSHSDVKTSVNSIFARSRFDNRLLASLRFVRTSRESDTARLRDATRIVGAGAGIVHADSGRLRSRLRAAEDGERRRLVVWIYRIVRGAIWCFTVSVLTGWKSKFGRFLCFVLNVKKKTYALPIVGPPCPRRPSTNGHEGRVLNFPSARRQQLALGLYEPGSGCDTARFTGLCVRAAIVHFGPFLLDEFNLKN